MLILDCDVGQINGNLISCVRYIISDKQRSFNTSQTSVLLLIHLPRKYSSQNFVSFQGESWICYHIDELIPESDLFQWNETMHEGRYISDLFHSTSSDEGTGSACSEAYEDYGLRGRLYNCIQDVVTRMERSTTSDVSYSRKLIFTLQQLLTAPATHGRTGQLIMSIFSASITYICKVDTCISICFYFLALR